MSTACAVNPVHWALRIHRALRKETVCADAPFAYQHWWGTGDRPVFLTLATSNARTANDDDQQW